MILFVMRGANSGTLSHLLKHYERDLSRSIGTVPYETLTRPQDLPPAVVVFSDIEAITLTQREIASQVANGWIQQGVRVLNHPAKALRRYELLEALHAKGPNSFRAYRSHSLPSTIRFPVFLRLERDHDGPKTPMIETREELEQVVLEGWAKGLDPHELLVVEYLENRCADGMYRKYAAFRVGDRIVARHLVISQDWMVKVAARVKRQEFLDEEHEYMEKNPHAAKLMELFEIAGLEYGRIDYSLVDGKIQTWEINSNPIPISKPEEYSPSQLPHHQAYAKRLREAIEALNHDLVRPRPVELRPTV